MNAITSFAGLVSRTRFGSMVNVPPPESGEPDGENASVTRKKPSRKLLYGGGLLLAVAGGIYAGSQESTHKQNLANMPDKFTEAAQVERTMESRWDMLGNLLLVPNFVFSALFWREMFRSGSQPRSGENNSAPTQ